MKKIIMFLTSFIFLFTSYVVAQEETKIVKSDTLKTVNSNQPNSPQAEEGDVKISDGTNTLIRITDEGTFGAIEIKNGVPSITTDKLYNDGGTLKFDNSSLGGGATKIDDLTDAKYIGNSIFLGNLAGDKEISNPNNFNIGIGPGALEQNTTGVSNTAVGYFALSNTTGNSIVSYEGNYNTGFGSGALRFNTFGYQNTAIGSSTLVDNTTGYQNVALGHNSMRQNETGFQNTAIGTDALSNSTGSGNVALGYLAGSNESGNDKLYIENSNSSSPLIWGDFANDIAAINGNFGVGTQNPDAKVTIVAASSGEVPLRVKIGGGTKFKVEENGGVAIGLNSSSTPANGLYVHGDLEYNAALTSVSDKRFKTNIKPIENAIERIKSIRGVYYEWNRAKFPERDFTDKHQIGVLAQEVEKEFPELVRTGVDGYKSVDYTKLAPILIEAVKEQQEIFKYQDERIKTLEEENQNLKTVINENKDLRDEMIVIKATLNKLVKQQPQIKFSKN